MMTLGTRHPHPQKQLSHVFHLSSGSLDLAIPCDRRMSLRVTGRRQHAAHKLIVGHVFPKRTPNPRMEFVCVWNVGAVASLIAQHRGPFVREVIGIARTIDQAIDQAIPLCRICVRQKLFHFGDRRQPSRDVDGSPTDKCRIVAQCRRRNAKLSLLRKHEVVDKRFLRRSLQHRHSLRNDRSKDTDGALETHHDGHFARHIFDCNASRCIGERHF